MQFVKYNFMCYGFRCLLTSMVLSIDKTDHHILTGILLNVASIQSQPMVFIAILFNIY